MTLIPTLWRQRQTDVSVRVQLGLTNEFQNTQGYPGNPVSNNNKTLVLKEIWAFPLGYIVENINTNIRICITHGVLLWFGFSFCDRHHGKAAPWLVSPWPVTIFLVQIRPTCPKIILLTLAFLCQLPIKKMPHRNNTLKDATHRFRVPT